MVDGNWPSWTPDGARLLVTIGKDFTDTKLAYIDVDGGEPEILPIDLPNASESAVNALGAKLVQLTMPGVPDVYQGTEFWDRSLTDPDNRRPFSFDARKRALAALDAGEQPASYLDETAKLLVTSRALRLRRDRPELFTGYAPVAASGPAAGHLLAFNRGGGSAGALTLATRLPRGLEQRGGWQDTAIRLATAMTDELTGRSFGPGEVVVGQILGTYPVALLVPTA